MTAHQDGLSALHKSMTDAIDGDSKFDGLITHWLADLEKAMAERDRLIAIKDDLLAALRAAVAAIGEEVSAGADGEDTHPMINRHSDVADSGRAAIRRATER